MEASMNQKIIISTLLRIDIINKRKEIGLSAYDLSEKSGHSKYWLPNIEVGRTKKISVEDLLSIYKYLIPDTDIDMAEYIANLTPINLVETMSELLEEYQNIQADYQNVLSIISRQHLSESERSIMLDPLLKKKENCKKKMHEIIDNDEMRIRRYIHNNPERFQYMSNENAIIQAIDDLEINLYNQYVESDSYTDIVIWSSSEEASQR